MNKYITEAIDGFNVAFVELREYTEKNTDFALTAKFDGYPIRFVFEPTEDTMQESLFQPDENGAIGEITVICSSSGVGVDLGIKCHIQAEVLKKLLSKCASTCEAYLHAQRAQAVEAKE